MHDGKVLIIRESKRYQDAASVGQYDVVGGRMEPGQHFKDSLLREVQEETGLHVEIGDIFFVDDYRPVVRGEQWQIVRMFFVCKPTSTHVVLSEDHDAFDWIDPTTFKTHHITPNLYPAFEAYLSKYS